MDGSLVAGRLEYLLKIHRLKKDSFFPGPLIHNYATPRHMNFALEILACDSALLVINKPAGLLTIPDGYNPLKHHLRKILEPEYGQLWIVHRLDKDTSGVIVLARTAAAHRSLNAQFVQNQVEKSYQAIIVGLPPWEEKTIDAPLRAGVGRRKRSVINPSKGKSAVTKLHIVERFQNNALVEARPKTGRTHQIRAHLYSLGYPILSDPLYGDGVISPYITRLALHAQILSFNHPLSEERLVFTAPLPADMKYALKNIPKSTSN